MKIALVTWDQLPQLSEDDRKVVPLLRGMGHAVTPAVWSAPSVAWGSFDSIVVRSTWDYYRRYDAFLQWVDRVGSDGRLWNPAAVIRWNSHKSYLLALEAAGVPIVPTRMSRDLPGALETGRRNGWSQVVVKAAVSAGGYRTYRVDLTVPLAEPAPWALAAPVGEVLVQPYEPEVERSGERSLVFFRGRYSHAFLRAPRLAPGSTLEEGAPLEADDDEVRLGLAALRCAPGPTLYGRVDMVRNAVGAAQVMELEVIEPALALRSSPAAATRFAQAIAATFSAGGGAKDGFELR